MQRQFLGTQFSIRIFNPSSDLDSLFRKNFFYLITFTLKYLSQSLLIRTFSIRQWNINTTRQEEKWLVIKEFIISSLCLKFVDNTSLLWALIFWLTFLHKDSICSSNFRSLSDHFDAYSSFTPTSTKYSFPLLILRESFPDIRRWYFSGTSPKKLFLK